MNSEKRLIDAKQMEAAISKEYGEMQATVDSATYFVNTVAYHRIKQAISDAPTVAAVPLEAYNELCEMFMDYVCSGVPNPAPFCENACDECLNAYGWCSNGENEACKGFVPKGRSEHNA